MKLPLNCKVDYFSNFLNSEDSKALYNLLIDKYKLDQSRLIIEAGGRTIATDSFKIIFSNQELIRKNSHPEHIHGKVYEWSGLLTKLKQSVEQLLNKQFDLAMCLYYPDGNYFAPYHFDQQTSGHKTSLPSISLGETREFCFKHNKSQDIYSLDLVNGSLLVMGDYCQNRYTHSLLKNPKYKNGRINITFREASYK